MGKSVALVMAIASGVSAASSIIGGIQQNNEAKKQAANAREEAAYKARIEARENIEAEKRQKVAFLSSGVSLEGSPLLVLAETKRRGDENMNNILKTGENQASSIRASGRSALIGGLTKGVTSAAQGYSDWNNA